MSAFTTPRDFYVKDEETRIVFFEQELSLRVGDDDYSLEDFDESWDDKASEIRQMDRDREKSRDKFYTVYFFQISFFSGV